MDADEGFGEIKDAAMPSARALKQGRDANRPNKKPPLTGGSGSLQMQAELGDEFLQILLVLFVEAIEHGTVDVEDRTGQARRPSRPG